VVIASAAAALAASRTVAPGMGAPAALRRMPCQTGSAAGCAQAPAAANNQAAITNTMIDLPAQPAFPRSYPNLTFKRIPAFAGNVATYSGYTPATEGAALVRIIASDDDGFSISLPAAASTLFPAYDSLRLNYRHQRLNNFIVDFKRARVRQPAPLPNLRLFIYSAFLSFFLYF
jgi:hypothetical protein